MNNYVALNLGRYFLFNCPKSGRLGVEDYCNKHHSLELYNATYLNQDAAIYVCAKYRVAELLQH